MSEQRPAIAIGSVGMGGERVAQDVTAGLAEAAGGATRSMRIDTLRLTLPEGASRAEIAREIRRALDRAARDGR